MVESERVILGELELLAPATEVPVPDWQQVRRRVEPSSSLNRRRVRLAIGVAAVALVAIAGASAAYLTSRAGSPTPVTNGELVIDSAPGGVAQLSSVRTDGRLRVPMEVPATVPLRQSQWHVVVSGGRQATRGRTCDGWRQLTVCRPRRPNTTHGKVQAPVGGREMPGQRIRASGGVDWSPAGRWIAFTCGSSKILLIRPATAGERAISTGSPMCGRRRGRPMGAVSRSPPARLTTPRST